MGMVACIRNRPATRFEIIAAIQHSASATGFTSIFHGTLHPGSDESPPILARRPAFKANRRSHCRAMLPTRVYNIVNATPQSLAWGLLFPSFQLDPEGLQDPLSQYVSGSVLEPA